MSAHMNILISSCLLGEPCRWHGKRIPTSGFVRRWLADHPDAYPVPVCPEVLGGLPVPRPPVKRRKGRVYETCPDKENRKNVTGADVTDAFILGAKKTLAVARRKKCTIAILCKWSPSCDCKGITGKLLAENGIKIINTW